MKIWVNLARGSIISRLDYFVRIRNDANKVCYGREGLMVELAKLEAKTKENAQEATIPACLKQFNFMLNATERAQVRDCTKAVHAAKATSLEHVSIGKAKAKAPAKTKAKASKGQDEAMRKALSMFE